MYMLRKWQLEMEFLTLSTIDMGVAQVQGSLDDIDRSLRIVRICTMNVLVNGPCTECQLPSCQPEADLVCAHSLVGHLPLALGRHAAALKTVSGCVYLPYLLHYALLYFANSR